MKTATMLSMQWLTTVVTLGLFWLVTTEGLALEMVAALLVFLMEKQHFVNVSLCIMLLLLCLPVCCIFTYIGVEITGAWNVAALSGGVVAIVMVLILLVVIFLLVTITKKRKSKCNLRIYLRLHYHIHLAFVIWPSETRQLSGNEVPIAAPVPVYEEVYLAMKNRQLSGNGVPAGPVYEEVDLAMTPRTQDIQVESNEAYGQVRK